MRRVRKFKCPRCYPVRDKAIESLGYVAASHEAARRGRLGWIQKKCPECERYYFPKRRPKS